MINLLAETIRDLKSAGKNPSDVVWVGTITCKTTWEQFKTVADVNYDNGYGSAQVAQDLLVVGRGWWLERHEYDGSEWWEFKETMKEPERSMELKAVTIDQAEALGYDVSCGWESLATLNGAERV